MGHLRKAEGYFDRKVVFQLTTMNMRTAVRKSTTKIINIKPHHQRFRHIMFRHIMFRTKYATNMRQVSATSRQKKKKKKKRKEQNKERIVNLLCISLASLDEIIRIW